ncbi:MAG TPA: hypothetical protein VGJ59_17105 [Jatrophihabitantaceae bacterium]
MSGFLAGLSSGLIAAWGIAHVLPTSRVVAGYADTSRDNRLVIAQEWIAEALTMWFVSALVLVITSVGDGSTRAWVYRVCALLLLAVGTLTAATGARTSVVFFKICPVVLTSYAGLLLAASWV